MITTQSRFNPVTKTLGKRTQFTVNLANRAHIMGILSGLYADPIKAVIRELCVNATESHKASENADPIKVTLPSQSGPSFIIRDQGLGLTLEEFEKLMASYGSSGEYKSTSNEYTGGFGLGCKAPAAYTDQWTVTCTKGGRRWTLACFKDEFGVPAFDVLDESETDDPNGVEIKIPVKSGDVDHFRRKAIEVFEVFTIKPTVTNATKEELEDLHKITQPALQHGNWKLFDRDDTTESCVVMGDVRYPINYSSFKLPDKLASMTMLPLELTIEVGGMQVAPSREALMYTPMTVKRLTAELENIFKTLGQVLKTKVEKATNWWDACLAANLFKHDWRYGSDMEALLKRLRKDLKWQGHDLDGVIVRPSVKVKNPSTGDDEEKGDRITFWSIGWRDWGKQRLKCEEVNSILVGRKVTVYLVGDCKGLRRGQLKHAYETSFFKRNEGHQYYVVTTKVPFETLTKAYPKLEWIKYESSSVLPEPPISTVNGDSSEVKNAKHTKGKTFSLDLSNQQRHMDKSSDAWLLTDGNYTDDDVWIEIEKFQPIYPFNNLSLSGLREFFNALKKAGVLKGRLLAKKKGEKLPDGVTVLGREFENIITKFLDSDTKLAHKVWMAHEMEHHNMPGLTGLSLDSFKKDSKLAKGILKSDLGDDHPASCIVALVNQKFSDVETSLRYVIDRYNGGRSENGEFKLTKYKPAKEMSLAWQEEQLIKGWPVSRWAQDNSWRTPDKYKACMVEDLVSYWGTKQ